MNIYIECPQKIPKIWNKEIQCYEVKNCGWGSHTNGWLGIRNTDSIEESKIQWKKTSLNMLHIIIMEKKILHNIKLQTHLNFK